MPSVFIAHSSDNEAVAAGLRWVIRHRIGLNAFAASDGGPLRPDAEWWSSIRAALGEARVLLCLLNRASLQRPWVSFGSAVFWWLEKPVIPVCFGDLRTKELPFPFAVFQGVDLPADLYRLLLTLNEHIQPNYPMPPRKPGDPSDKALLQALEGARFVPPFLDLMK